MNQRRRVFVALLAFGVLAAAYLWWAVGTLTNLYTHFINGYVNCGRGPLFRLNACVRFHPGLAWLELTVATAVVLGVAWALVRWTQQPLAGMTRAISRFGPTNLAQRLDAGPGRDETLRLAAAVDDMLARLAEGYQAQQRFAASASHELRTPLATQRALVEVSLTQPLTAEQQELLARQLLATNERNVTVIDGLLTLAEAEQGLDARDHVPLHEVVRDVLAASAAAAQRRSVRLDSRVEPAVVIGERALLERLAANLVDNAIKYNVDGGVVRVRLDAAPPTLTVANTGPAVPADQVDSLFEPFRRMAGDRVAGTDGAGLGLTIVRSVVRAHGGRIEARAEPSGGLVVSVGLPAAG